MDKKTIALDFDGVFNQYKGYQPDNLYEPRQGLKEFLIQLNQNYNVCIYSSREPYNIILWLKKYGLERYISNVSRTKPPAIAYIDDRAIRFNGNYDEILQKIEQKTYWEKGGNK